VEIDHRLRIFAVSRNRVSHVPYPDLVLHQGDIIYASVKDDAFARAERYMEE